VSDRPLMAKRYLAAWLVLLACLLATSYAGYYSKSDVESDAQRQFAFDCDEIQLKIAGRLEAHKQVLLGAAALFDASDGIERDEWHAYAKRMQIDQHFNGIQGLGFSLLIRKDQLARHIATIRKQGFPAYTVRPAGDRDVYSSIIYLAPFSGRNLRAFGYDMYAESVRRAAMEQARDENRAALSGKVLLVQETEKEVQAGTLMYMPAYRKSMPIETIAQRRAALDGWVYSPFRMDDLLAGVLKGRITRQTPTFICGFMTVSVPMLTGCCTTAKQAWVHRHPASALFNLERHMKFIWARVDITLCAGRRQCHQPRLQQGLDNPGRRIGGESVAVPADAVLYRFQAQCGSDSRRVDDRIAQQQQRVGFAQPDSQAGQPGDVVTGCAGRTVAAVEAMHPGMLCSIFLLDEDGQHLRCGAAPSLPESYRKAIEGLTVSDGFDLCETAAYRGEACHYQRCATTPPLAIVAWSGASGGCAILLVAADQR